MTQSVVDESSNAANTAAAAEGTPGVPQASRGERLTSYDVADFAVPEGKEENWRFTPLKRLRGLHDGTALADATVKVDADVSPDVRVETVGRDDQRLGAAGVPSDRIAAQAYSVFSEATVVTVPKETKASQPSIVKLTGPGEGNTAYGHLQVRAEPFSESVVVVDYSGSGSYADNVEFLVGDSAKLTVVSVQDWADDAVHVSEQHLQLGKDATLKHTAVTLGGDLVRVSPTAKFAGKGGDVEMLGLYFTDAGQHQEHRLFVDHKESNCKSKVTYKGALQGDKAHAVWIGDVLIGAAAEGTDTFELNRNLVLTEGARADSVPNLEIETGEIAGAGHASATGHFDEEQLFYLMSRGIEEGQARRLVVRGFFHEILMRIEVPEIRERLEAAIESELEAVGV